MKKIGILYKFLTVMLILCFVPFLTIGYIGISGINNLGNTIIDENALSMKNKTIENLQSLVLDKTNQINDTFNNIEKLINAEEQFAIDVYCNPSNYTYIEQYDHYAFRENASNPPPDLAYSEKFKRNVSFDYLTYKIAPNISKEDVNETINIFSRMITFFKSAVIQHDLIRWIYIGTPQGVHFCYPGHGYNESYDPRTRDWYTRANETGEFGWSEPYVDAGGLGLMITASKPVCINNKLIGVVATDITIETINEEIINLEIGKTGYPFLIDENADVIARPNYTAGDVRWDESFKTENLLNTTNTRQTEVIQKMVAGDSGAEEVAYQDEKRLIVFSPVKSTKWSLGVSISRDETLGGIVETKNKLSKNVEDAMTIMLYILIVVGVLLLIISVIFTKGLTHPIKKLTEGAERIRSGELDVDVDIKTKDEIGALSDTFNKMVKDLKKSREEIEAYSRGLEEKVKERTSELRKSEAKYRGLVENVPDIVYALNSKGEIISINKTGTDLLGYTGKELLGAHFSKIIFKEDLNKCAASFNELKSGKRNITKGLKFRLLTKQGRIMHSELNARATYDKNSNLMKTEGVIRDISILEKTMAELKKSRKELEKAYEQLKILDKMKSNFLEMAAHELRTPLVAIKTYIDLISDEKFGRVNKKQKEKIEIMSKNIEQLTKIINEMIELSRIESGKLDIRKEYISIPELVKMIVDDVKPMADEKGQRIIMDMPDSLPNIAVDVDLVSKVFMNLLTNAVKYTPEKKRIAVKAYDEKKNIHLTVQDEGIGIPEKDLDKIFDKFYTGKSAKGIGLGLAIVKGIVEQHNGKVWAESKIGKGSTFHVLLPKTEEKT